LSSPVRFGPLDFLERQFLGGALVLLGGAGRFVIGDGLGMFPTLPPVLQMSRNPRRGAQLK
jgi:hypothetical protein